ncbi:hypothetical protein LHK12_21770 [Providencia rettgeri]|nr:hypothetical protein [Providencia rettgeri]
MCRYSGNICLFSPLYSRAFDVLFEEKILQSPDWNPVDKQIKFRIDGFAKVQGRKSLPETFAHAIFLTGQNSKVMHFYSA